MNLPPSEDVSIRAPDGVPLFGRLWPAQQGRGGLLIAHGLGEHQGRYQHVVERLAPALGLSALGFDFRGHGRSPGRRGSVAHYQDLIDDLAAAAAFLRSHVGGGPLWILGHSQGALLATEVVRTNPGLAAGLILSSPSFQVVIPVPAWKRALAEALRKVAPTWAISGKVPPAWLSTVEGYAQGRAGDPLVHPMICANIYFGMKSLGTALLSSAGELTPPVLIVMGGRERIVSLAAARTFCDRLGSRDRTFREFNNSAHEPLNDVESDAVLGQIEDWIRARIGQAGENAEAVLTG